MTRERHAYGILTAITNQCENHVFFLCCFGFLSTLECEQQESHDEGVDVS